MVDQRSVAKTGKTGNLLPFLVSLPAAFYIRLVGMTNRFEVIGVDYREELKQNPGPYIFAFWHSRLMLPLYFFRKYKVAVLVSWSKDGEVITQVMNRFGIEAVRGSASRRGAEGLLQLLRCLKRGMSVVITPDGPKGPREKVLPGTMQLAKLSGVPIIPVSFSCTRRKHLNSWDRFLVPFPFGTVYLMTGESISVHKDDDPDTVEEKRLQLQDEMSRITRYVDETV